MPAETMKIIINDLFVKKALSVEIPVYLFKKCDFILEIMIVCVTKVL